MPATTAESRPYLGIGAGRFVRALAATIGDVRLRALAMRRHDAIGNTGHWIDATDALYGVQWREAHRRQYRDALDTLTVTADARP